MSIATSKNMTIVGIAAIVGVIAAAAAALFDGDPSTNVDLGASLAAIVAAITAILGKGAASTGGTVPETAEAAKRVG